MSLTGVIEVLARDGAETVILTEAVSGVTWALTGDVASELRQSWGLAVTVIGIPSGTGGDAPADSLRFEVIEYAFEGEPDGGSSEP